MVDRIGQVVVGKRGPSEVDFSLYGGVNEKTLDSSFGRFTYVGPSYTSVYLGSLC